MTLYVYVLEMSFLSSLSQQMLCHARISLDMRRYFMWP